MRPRIRTLKPETWADERISAMSRDARLLFVGMVTLADDEGRFRARRSELVGSLFPDDSDAYGLIDGWVNEIKRSGSIVFYVVDATPYGAFRHWKRHQRINRPTPSELPAPPDRKIVRDNRVKTHDASGNFKKTAIPERVRRAVARAAGGEPGRETVALCHWCGAKGQIAWTTLPDGRPSSWVKFIGLELDHKEPESKGGETDETNLVLACVSCNRRRGNRYSNSHPDSRDSVISENGMITDISPADPIRSVPDPVVSSLCQRLAERARANDSKFDLRKAASKRWLDDMAGLLADRKGDTAEIERVIDWCQADRFERSNVLSPGKLRDRFTALLLKAQSATTGHVVPIRPARETASDWLQEINGGAA